MDYISTRGNFRNVKSAFAIKTGMVPRGGLFVPQRVPEVDIHALSYEILENDRVSYPMLAFEILKLFLTDYTDSELLSFVKSAYNKKNFDSEEIAPLFELNEETEILELFHGPTAAFKDMALQILPYFLTSAAEKYDDGKEIVILVATSGDTGKAALEGFKDVPGTRIIVFYPKDGVSKVQEMQMLSTGGKNTTVIGVNGNFDDCQTAVKEIFADEAFGKILAENGFEFSSANSINWGRLVPQIVYYFFAYYKLVEKKKIFIGEPINFSVPTGNFGNILAGYYAKKMGLPVKNFICASNKNKVLTDFIQSGIYDKNREFYKTMSPSMDILISSNLERFLFELTHHNPEKIQRWYEDLGKKGQFKIDNLTAKSMIADFYGAFSNEEETLHAIKSVFQKFGYVMDTHTAVAYAAVEKYRSETKDDTVTVIDSTASPFKFNRSVMKALDPLNANQDEFELLNTLSELAKIPVHPAVKGIQNKKINHDSVINIEEAKAAIQKALRIH